MRPLLQLSHVCFEREGREILRDICLDVRKGEFVAITGPNGGGKTTLLRLILGLLQPTAGEIKKHASSFGYLPQKSTVDSHFPITVGEVVESALLSSTQNKKEKLRMRDKVLRNLELSDLSQRPIGKLSGGQLQRALIARALVSEPDVLVLDEPMSYLDRHAENLLLKILERQKACGTTILMVTHQQATIVPLADRILYIDTTSEPLSDKL